MGGKFLIPVKNKMKSYTLTVTTDSPLTKLQVMNNLELNHFVCIDDKDFILNQLNLDKNFKVRITNF